MSFVMWCLVGAVVLIIVGFAVSYNERADDADASAVRIRSAIASDAADNIENARLRMDRRRGQ